MLHVNTYRLFKNALDQRGKNSYRTQKGWMDSGTSYFSGNAVAFVPGAVTNWMVVIVFQKPVASMQVSVSVYFFTIALKRLRFFKSVG